MTSKAKKIVKTSLQSILVIICLILVETKACEITLSDISGSVIRSLTNCDEKNDTLSLCLKRRSVLILDKYTRATNVISLIGDSVTLVKDYAESNNNSKESHRSLGSSGLTQKKLDEYLPIEEGPRKRVLDALLVSSASKFLQTRSLQIKLPKFLAHFVGSGLSEGRGKKAGKYYAAFVLGAAIVMGTMIPLKMGTLALISGKALMTSLIAILLSGIVALKKHGSGKNPSSTTYEVINVPAGHTPHGHQARSIPLSTVPPEVIDPALLPKIINRHRDGPYSMYKTNYVYNDSADSSGESDYVILGRAS